MLTFRSPVRRILFVDDDQQVLDALRNLLRRQRKQWDMAFALGGEPALEELAKGPFDVVVSDMRMPGMDGNALLERVRALQPRCARIVLSGHAERDAVARALGVAHQFLSKPCDSDTLRTVIEHTCALQELLNRDSNRDLVHALETLPSVPRTYPALMEALSRPELQLAEIAGIVEQDTALTARFLQLANSPGFGLGGRMQSVQQAIGYLGTELLKVLTLTAQVFAAMEAAAVEGFSLAALQAHSLHAAQLARKLFRDPELAQQAFTAALVHDLGHVVAALCMPDRYAQVLRLVRESGKPKHVIEREVLGVTHAELGAHLLGVWGLPFAIIEAVAYHHMPSTASAGALEIIAAVHAADAFVDRRTPKLDDAFVAKAGLTTELSRWREIAARFDDAQVAAA
jgi:HD-like signal output (HDOD) protein